MLNWLAEKILEARKGGATQVLVVLQDDRTLLISDTFDITTSIRLPVHINPTDAYTHLKAPGEPPQVFNALSQLVMSDEDFSPYTDLVSPDRYKLIEISWGVSQEELEEARAADPNLEICDLLSRDATLSDEIPELDETIVERLNEQLDVETDIATREAYGIRAAANNTLPFRLPFEMACRIRPYAAGALLQDSCRELLEQQVLARLPSAALPSVLTIGADFLTVSVPGYDGLFEEVCELSGILQSGYQATCLGLLQERLLELENPVPSDLPRPEFIAVPEVNKPVLFSQTNGVAQGMAQEETTQEADTDEAERLAADSESESLVSKISSIRPLALNEHPRPTAEVRRIISLITEGWRPMTSSKAERLNNFVRTYPFLAIEDIVTTLQHAKFSSIEAQVVACFLATTNDAACARELEMDPKLIRKICSTVKETLGDRRLRNPMMVQIKLSLGLVIDDKNRDILTDSSRPTSRPSSRPSHVLSELEGQVKIWYAKQGERGGTAPECSQALGLSSSKLSVVVFRLVQIGVLMETGEKRGEYKSKIRVIAKSV